MYFFSAMVNMVVSFNRKYNVFSKCESATLHKREQKQSTMCSASVEVTTLLKREQKQRTNTLAPFTDTLIL